jgi:hypothetical protein
MEEQVPARDNDEAFFKELERQEAEIRAYLEGCNLLQEETSSSQGDKITGKTSSSS